MLKKFIPYYFLKEIDIFGTPVTLNYNKDSQYRTYFGGSVTICCICIIILLCISTIQTLFAKTQVTFVQSQNYSVSPSLLEFDHNDFMIAVQYDQPNFIQRPFVNITLQQRHYHRNLDGTTTSQNTTIYLEPCTLDHFRNLPSFNFNWTYAFQLDNLSNFLCLPKGIKYQIGGIFENEDFYFLKFSITYCTNSTYQNPKNPWNPICERPEVIQANQLQNSRVRFFISNNILNPEKATNSITSFLDSQIFNIQQGKMYTTANLYINSQTLITDQSIFPIQDIETQNLLQFKRSETWQQNAVGNFTNFCEVFFERSYYSTIANKSYLKLVQVVSYIGGFSQVFILISAFIVSKYNGYIFCIELANKLYDFDIHEDSVSKGKRSNKLDSHHRIQNHLQIQNSSPLNYQKDEQAYQKSSWSHYNLQSKFTCSNIQLNKNLLTTSTLQNIRNDNPFNNNLNLQTAEQDNHLDQMKKIQTEKEITLKNYKNTDFVLDSKINQKQTPNDIQIYENSNADVDNQQISLRKESLNQEKSIHIESVNQTNQFQQTKKDTIQFDEFNQDLQVKNEFNFTNRIQAISEQKNIQDDEKQITQTEPFFQRKESEILDTKTNNNNGQFTSRKNLYQYSESTPKGQVRRAVNSFGRAARSMTKIVQQKFGGAAEQFLEKEFKSIIEREKKIWLNFKYIVNQLTCGKFFQSEHVKLIDKAKNQVSEDLDIFTILDRQKEVEKMKKLFFNDDQQVLFNFFPKPLISISKDNTVLSMKQIKQEQIDLEQSVNKVQKQKKKLNISFKNIGTIAKAIVKFKKGRNSTMSNYQRLFNHYKKLTRNSETNNPEAGLNKKLIELLGDEMRNIFEVAVIMDQKPHENKQVQQLPLSQFYIERKQSRENDIHTEQNINLENLHKITESNQQQTDQNSSKLITFNDLSIQSSNTNNKNQQNDISIQISSNKDQQNDIQNNHKDLDNIQIQNQNEDSDDQKVQKAIDIQEKLSQNIQNSNKN
ncbi:transmembrane protein, putative (macronuclear) [Tetrahymena thermophila SB210]|uniref:Transmembrane protein, putative n=1 Tax=Tetrahymena thermophila (strain SB210) TaxID=312017 RepID=Q22SH3_TETTS|nr:transmembrane protein, putative [Tetrahymena thermophila SB210]EAR87799.3 transmembrane protein, putative [Tetrahymena thermophila SB210]|eukprot:XP_001008044.3 transmembrane protein, putative [Tetrahymena thermophila SB210]